MVRAMKPVTDPTILQQLNSGQMKPVSDPAILEQLNQKPKAPSGFLHGAMDIPVGALQLAPKIPYIMERLTPYGLIAGSEKIKESPIHQKLDYLSKEIIDPYVKKREESYQERRKAAGKEGIDWPRIAGNIANPINYIGGAGIWPTIGRGGGMGLMQPVSDTEDFAKTKALQAGAGAIGGAIGKGIGDKLIAPATQRAGQVASLLKEKVPLTLGQRAGGFTKALEDKATSILILGDMIKGAQERSIVGLNKAAYARALNPIGEKLPKDLPVGRQGIDYVSNKLSEKYDDLLPKLTGKLDDQFGLDMANLKNMVQADDVMDAAEKAKYNNIIANSLNKRISKSSGITGNAIKDIQSELGKKADKFSSGTASVSQRQLADALKQTQKVLRDMVTRSNPKYGNELGAIDKGYANLARVQLAGNSRGAQDGLFSPSMLQSAVRSSDETVRKNAYARGKALMQDLSDAGGLLPNKIPNSGTVDRAALFGLGAAGLGGYGQTEAPGSNLATLGAIALAPSLLYTSGGVAAQNALANALRSQAAQSVLQPVGQTLPYLGAPLAFGITAK